MLRKLRVYVDTSVIGGCLDPEFAEASWELVESARSGKVILLVSDVLVEELRRAPSEVKDVLEELPDYCLERVFSTEESSRLRDCYLSAGIVGPSSSSDAHHVALATLAAADLMVSWNFKHIVQYAKIRGFSGVNLIEGYSPIEIRSPREVVSDAEDENI